MREVALRLCLVLLPLLFLCCSSALLLQASQGNKYRYYYSLIAPKADKDMLFRDEHLIIQFRLDDAAIKFQTQNISVDTMQIFWNKAALNVNGEQFVMRNSGNLYATGAAPPRIR